MKDLTSFQLKCKDTLISKLNSLGSSIGDLSMFKSDKTRFAEEEVFLETSVDALRIWIYEDGAHIRYKDADFPFEAQDYKTEESLICAFLEKVVVLARLSGGTQI